VPADHREPSRSRAAPAAGRAQVLACELVSAGAEVVYGGGRVGLMGVAADAVLAVGGRITGVMPISLMDADGAQSPPGSPRHRAGTRTTEGGLRPLPA
jgi:predicted Rossmann-fold nucleotide-binding protein